MAKRKKLPEWASMGTTWWSGVLGNCLIHRMPRSRELNEAIEESKRLAAEYLETYPEAVANACTEAEERGYEYFSKIIDLLEPPFYAWAKKRIPDLLDKDKSPY